MSDLASRLHINWGPGYRERSREPWQTRWCFKCRKRLPHDVVIMEPVEPSYYGPHAKVECAGCGEDHVHFPGTWDGPTLTLGD
jgi:hypothetical protein